MVTAEVDEAISSDPTKPTAQRAHDWCITPPPEWWAELYPRSDPRRSPRRRRAHEAARRHSRPEAVRRAPRVSRPGELAALARVLQSGLWRAARPRGAGAIQALHSASRVQPAAGRLADD